MKKTLVSIMLTLAMILCLAIPAYAANSEFTLTVTVDDATVTVGDIVTVDLVVEPKGDNDFKIYTFQDYICFDDEMFEFVPGSLSVYYDEYDSAAFNATVQKNEVFVNRVAVAPVVGYNRMVIASFRLRALALGECSISHSVVEVLDKTLTPVTVEAVDCKLEIIEEDDDVTPDPVVPRPVIKYGIALPENVENGSITVSRNEASADSIVNLYPVPDDGYEVDTLTVKTKTGKDVEVFVDENGDYAFKMARGGVTVEVTFKEIEEIDGPEDPVEPPVDPVDPTPGEHECPSAAYSDINTEKWYHEACDYVIENGIMNGFPDGTFEPDATTSRAMIATMIWRLAGEPKAAEASPFTDVTEGAWYYDAVCWAAENGIVNGYGEGIFAPDDLITREQFAAMIYRYEQSKGGGFKGMWMFLLDFTDREDVSDWAYEAVCWCTMNKVINGMGDGTMLPGGNATRAHAAQILMNYITME